MKPLVRRAVAIAAVLAVSAATFYSVTRGRHLQLTAPEVFLGAAPFVGRDFRDGWDWRFAWSLVGAIVILSATALATLRGWWWRVRVGWVVAGAAIGAGAFGVLLALTDGFDGLTHGAADPSEYWANLSKTPPAGEFLRTFVAHLGRYSVHVRGHPPGFTLLLKLLGAADLSRVWPVAGLSILGAVALPIGVLITVRAVAGDDWVRRSAPFLVVSPYAIWLVTSADSLYAAVGAVGVAAIAVSLRAVLRRCAVIGGLFGGVLLGLLIFGTYLGVLVGLVAIGCAFGRWRRDRRGVVIVLVAAMVGGLAVVVVFRAAGFWWFDGVDQTKREYWAGSAQFRPFSYFVVANLVVALAAIGPAGAFGLIRRLATRAEPLLEGDRKIWLLVGGALTALLISNFSRYTKGEVERIWLLFYPWIVLAASSLHRRHRPRCATRWVVLQGAAAIVLQAVLLTKW